MDTSSVASAINSLEQEVLELKEEVKSLSQGAPQWLVLQQRLAALQQRLVVLQEKDVLLMRAASGILASTGPATGPGDNDQAVMDAILAPLTPDRLPDSTEAIFQLAFNTQLPLLPSLCDELLARAPECAPLVQRSNSEFAAYCSTTIWKGLRLKRGGTKIMDCSKYTLELTDLLTILVARDRSAQKPEMELLANSSAKFVSTSGSLPLPGRSRPDILVMLDGLLMAFCKDKPHGGMDQALGDIRDYIKQGLPVVLYRHTPYILCYAAAGSSTRLGRALSNGEIELTWTLDVTQPQDGVRAVQTMLTWYRLMVCLLSMAAPEEERPVMYSDIIRPAAGDAAQGGRARSEVRGLHEGVQRRPGREHRRAVHAAGSPVVACVPRRQIVRLPRPQPGRSQRLGLHWTRQGQLGGRYGLLCGR